MNRRLGRIQRDIEQLTQSPMPNIAIWPTSTDNIEELTARLTGPETSPFADGSFYLSVKFPDRYPFEPPHVTFNTKIHHPNIDSQGRICLELLKMPPQGMWKPHMNLASVLNSVHMLMAEPNPNDPLNPEIAEQFKTNRTLFEHQAKQLTLKYATDSQAKSDTPRKATETETVTLPSSDLKVNNPKITCKPLELQSKTISENAKLSISTSHCGKKPTPPCDRNESQSQSQMPGGKKNPFAILGKKAKLN